MDSGRKKEGGGKYRVDGGWKAYGDIKRKIAKQHASNIGGTVVPDDVKIEMEMADYAGTSERTGKSERQWRYIMHGETTQNSGTGPHPAAFNIATFNTNSDEISYDTPCESWDNQHVRWSLQNSLQAGAVIYHGDGLSNAHKNRKQPGQKKRGPKPNV